ncbi:MAG: hypothetical protein IT521_16525 [Burkholderiales bacterium]|nr:hypothetical protein [Burkholderiales bacterium]
MAGLERIAKWPRIIAIALACVAVSAVVAQSRSAASAQGDVFNTQSGRRAPAQSDSFNTQSQRGGRCDTNIWIHAHGGRWDRCQYELDCPGPDTRLYGPPDRFPATDGARMRGYVRCAVDPCSPGGAQCWGHRESDDISTGGSRENKQAVTPPTNAVPGRKSIKRLYDPPAINSNADARTMVKAIDRCVREKGRLPYYASPRVSQSGNMANYVPATATIVYNPAQLDRQKPYIRAYYIAGAYGAYIVSLKEQQFGQPGTADERQRQRDHLIGYLAHCLLDLKLLPETGNGATDDPRAQLEDFIYFEGGGVPLTPADLGRERAFSYGWHAYPMSLLPGLRRD